MESIENSNFWRNDALALALAVEYHQVREATPEVVTETAEVFLDWLNGVYTDESEVVFPNG
jgi:hypothetical protein